MKDQINKFQRFTFKGPSGATERSEVYAFLKANVGTLGIKQSKHKHGGDQMDVSGQKIRPESTMSTTFRQVVRNLASAV